MVLDEVREKCLSWAADLRNAPGASSPDLLRLLERVEDEVALARAALAARSVERPAALTAVEHDLAALRDLYVAQLPRRATTSAPRRVPANRIDAPMLRIPEDECRRLYRECGNSWAALKTRYTNDPETLWQLWAFRKQVVDRTMTTLQQRYGVQWEAVGSTNLESDYDLSVTTHGTDPATHACVYDFEIVKRFNDTILAEFGVQPGTLFDTNLYASAPYRPAPALATPAPAAEAMARMAEAGQDVGALMKLRRYMSWPDYDAYTERIVGALRRGGKMDLAAATLKQFEEADALFQIAAFTVLDTCRELLEDDRRTLPDTPALAARRSDTDAAVHWTEEQLARIAEASLLGGQQQMLAAVLELEDRFPDLHMRVSNELYTRSLREVRALEARAASLHPERDRAALDGLAARTKTLATDAVLFANEAYLSEGPYLHVVKAIQAVLTAARGVASAERDAYITEHKAEELGKLSAGHFLQSFNEQLGDLLKDLRHYGDGASPGLGMYRSAKYVERLLDSALLLQQKVPDLDITLRPGGASAAATRIRVSEGLLAARKGELEFGDAGDALAGDALQHELDAFAIDEVREMFGVVTLRDYGRLFLDLGARVNAHLRAGSLGTEMQVAPGAERPYFS